MKKNVKEFFTRGLIFGGFGPIVAGIVCVILEIKNVEINLNGYQLFLAILSTYLIAFMQSATTIFHQIEELPVGKALLYQLTLVYLVYIVSYIANNWLPFKWEAILIFSVAFIITYMIIWIIIYSIINYTSKKLNQKI